jgi:hypothetical protein
MTLDQLEELQFIKFVGDGVCYILKNREISEVVAVLLLVH